MTERSAVGIIDIELYYPKLYVDQKELEQIDNCVGKYTYGLGQHEIAVCSVNEDAVSMALTVVHRMMERKKLSYSQIGRLDVGTAPLFDLSKSIKSHLMQLFSEEKSFSVEGADNIHACYGGTAALFNCVNWIESSSWDGRYAMVVTTGMAVGENDNPIARATGGAAAMCILVGVNPTCIIDSRAKGVYMRNYYDVYAPIIVNAAVVDPKLALWSCVNSLIMCSIQFVLNKRKIYGSFDLLSEKNIYIFHCPYKKLAQQGLIYMFYFHQKLTNLENSNEFDTILSFLESLLTDPNRNDERVKLEKDMLDSFSESLRDNYEKVTQMTKHLGNSYCSSLYVCLISLFGNYLPSDLSGKNLILYSFGAGSLSTMFSLQPSDSNEALTSIHDYCRAKFEELSTRSKISPQYMAQISTDRTHLNDDMILTENTEMKNLTENCYYLSNIDQKHRKFYRLY